MLRPFEPDNPFRSRLTAELAERIVQDLSTSQPNVQIQPTQLQIICSRLWEEYAPTHSTITEQDFRKLGGVKGILEGFLQSELTALEATRRSQVVLILGNLITEAGTRDVVSVDKLRGLIARQQSVGEDEFSTTLNFLEERRLINRTHQRGTYYYEIASEYLIQPIQREMQQLALERERAEAERLAQEQQRRAEEQARVAGRLFRLAVALLIVALLAVGAVGAAGFAWINWHRAAAERARTEQHAQLSFARELAAAAMSNLDRDPERSVLLALYAASVTYSVNKLVTPEAQDALRHAVQALRVRLTLAGHTDRVWGVVFSPDGTRLATASDDKTAKMWDAVSGREVLTLAGHTDTVWGVAFSPDGTRLVTASGDKTVRVYTWDMNIEDMMALAWTRVTRALTAEECQKYLHMEQCPPTP